jgi:hypothetical protein
MICYKKYWYVVQISRRSVYLCGVMLKTYRLAVGRQLSSTPGASCSLSYRSYLTACYFRWFCCICGNVITCCIEYACMRKRDHTTPDAPVWEHECGNEIYKNSWNRTHDSYEVNECSMH